MHMDDLEFNLTKYGWAKRIKTCYEGKYITYVKELIPFSIEIEILTPKIVNFVFKFKYKTEYQMEVGAISSIMILYFNQYTQNCKVSYPTMALEHIQMDSYFCKDMYKNIKLKCYEAILGDLALAVCIDEAFNPSLYTPLLINVYADMNLVVFDALVDGKIKSVKTTRHIADKKWTIECGDKTYVYSITHNEYEYSQKLIECVRSLYA